jgi:hypothetical protein
MGLPGRRVSPDMFAQPVTVTYLDGTAQDVTLTQWSIGQFGQYAQSRGWAIDPSSPGLMAITMLRFQAYVEVHRDPGTIKPSFDKWDQTVVDVSPVEGASGEVDPTQTAVTAG